MDTIFALATARGKAGVAVVRVSGPDAMSAGTALAGRLPPPRRAGLRTLRDADGQVLDEALTLVFERGSSFTGEDVVEFQFHGSLAAINAILAFLSGIDGLRLAEPGEFTRRALENDCLDLSQVEGLADLIEAETEQQRRQAVRVLSGALGSMAERWRTKLIRAAALLEATIDFADEDVPVDVTPEVRELLQDVLSDLSKELDGAQAAERIREGFEVAIVGPPNVGKSTLLNALAGREAAITSEVAGTTRDVIEVRMDLNGLAVTLLDTAGIRATEDRLEELGVERARARAESADLRVFIVEKQKDSLVLPQMDNDIVVVGKADLQGDVDDAVSGVTGQGIDRLIGTISTRLEQLTSDASAITRLRHRNAIENAVTSLGIALTEVNEKSDRADIVAEEIRAGIHALNSLVGRVDVEHVLDEIFASFCLGK